MSNPALILPTGIDEDHPAANSFVTMTIDGQLFGIPVLFVRDVLGPQRLTRIPLAPAEVAGSLNLRGRIVTEINVRTRLGLVPRPTGMRGMSVVVDMAGELYSLQIDQVGEVLTLPKDDLESTPPTLNPRWREISRGIFRLKDKLLVVLDVGRLLNLSSRPHAV